SPVSGRRCRAAARSAATQRVRLPNFLAGGSHRRWTSDRTPLVLTPMAAASSEAVNSCLSTRTTGIVSLFIRFTYYKHSTIPDGCLPIADERTALGAVHDLHRASGERTKGSMGGCKAHAKEEDGRNSDKRVACYPLDSRWSAALRPACPRGLTAKTVPP